MGSVEYQCVLQVLVVSKRNPLAIMSTFQYIIAFKIAAVIFNISYVSKMHLYSKQTYTDSTRVEEFEAYHVSNC